MRPEPRAADIPSGTAVPADSPLAANLATPRELKARLEMHRAGSPFLLLRSPDGAQQLVSLAGRDHLTVGRRIDSDISLPWDTRVSRLHAELTRVGRDWVISDDGLSSNGTSVGGERLVGRRRLLDGDLIQAGGTKIAFCAPGDGVDATSLADSLASPAARISPAQRRVLVALCRPFLSTGALSPPTNAQLADELHLAVDSIKSHLKALFDAFGLNDVPPRQKRAELVQQAVRSGAVQTRDVVQ